MAIVHSGKNAFCGLGSYHHFHLLSISICESVRAFKYTVSAIANLGEQSVDERPQPSHNLSFVLNKSTIQTTTTTNNALHTSAPNFAPRTRTQVPAPSTPLNAGLEGRVPYSRNERHATNHVCASNPFCNLYTNASEITTRRPRCFTTCTRRFRNSYTRRGAL